MALVKLLVDIVAVLISALQLFMMLRAILSWLPFDDSSALVQFVTVVTEPIILPVRNIMEKFGFASDLPIDLSFLVAYMLLMFVGVFLPAVHF